MLANELMIGDLVYYSHTEDGIAPYKEVICIQSEDLCRDSCVIETHFEPIPITPEILEKNGFEARGYEELVLDADEYCFALQKGVDGINAWWWEMFSSPIIPINYIHELQHVLRLCGIEKDITI